MVERSPRAPPFFVGEPRSFNRNVIAPMLSPAIAFLRYLAPVRSSEWVVYAKPPFAGPAQVVDYLGRYTHRVAIANHRLPDIADGTVTFRGRDYRDANRQKRMTLPAHEFIRRFLLNAPAP